MVGCWTGDGYVMCTKIGIGLKMDYYYLTIIFVWCFGVCWYLFCWFVIINLVFKFVGLLFGSVGCCVGGLLLVGFIAKSFGWFIIICGFCY